MKTLRMNVETRNVDSVINAIMIMMLNMKYEELTIKRYCNGITVKTEIEGNDDDVLTILANMRFLRKMDGLWNDRVDVNVELTEYGIESEWGYVYFPSEWDTPEYYKEYGKLEADYNV